MWSLNFQEGGEHEDTILKPYGSCPGKHGNLCLCQNLSFLPLRNTVCISTKWNTCSCSCHWYKEGAGLYLPPYLEARQPLLQFRMQRGIITLSLGDHMNSFWVSITVISGRKFPLKFYIFVCMYLLMYVGQYKDSKYLEMQVQKSKDYCQKGITIIINLHNREIPSPLNSLKSLPLLCQSHLA